MFQRLAPGSRPTRTRAGEQRSRSFDAVEAKPHEQVEVVSGRRDHPPGDLRHRHAKGRERRREPGLDGVGLPIIGEREERELDRDLPAAQAEVPRQSDGASGGLRAEGGGVHPVRRAR